MIYGFVLDIPAPIEVYDALHAEIVRRKDPRSCGMLLHVGRPTPEGFRVSEIWESKEQTGTLKRRGRRVGDDPIVRRAAPLGGAGTGGVRAARPVELDQRFEDPENQLAA